MDEKEQRYSLQSSVLDDCTTTLQTASVVGVRATSRRWPISRLESLIQDWVSRELTSILQSSPAERHAVLLMQNPEKMVLSTRKVQALSDPSPLAARVATKEHQRLELIWF